MTPRDALGAAGLVTMGFMPASFGAVFAQSTAPGAIVVTEEIVVQGRLLEEEEVAEGRLDAIPGGTGIVADDDLTGRATCATSSTRRTPPRR